MKVLTSLLLLASIAAAPTTAPSTQIAPQRADVPAAKVSTRPALVTRFHEMHDKFVKQAQAGNIDLLFLGDSITEGWAGGGKAVWKERYEKLNAANFGISGDKTQHVLWRIENGELENIKPKVVVLMIGTNNVGSNPPAQIAAGIEKIVKTIRAKTDAKVLLLAVFPRNKPEDASRVAVANVNETIAKLDDGKNVRYLDIGDKFLAPDKTIPREIMSDALHPSAKGYQIWADAMDPLLSEMLK